MILFLVNNGNKYNHVGAHHSKGGKACQFFLAGGSHFEINQR